MEMAVGREWRDKNNQLTFQRLGAELEFLDNYLSGEDTWRKKIEFEQ